MNLPRHVQTHIETRTGLPLGLASGYAKPGWCPKCGRAVIAGYDAPAIAALAIVDPYRASAMEEAAAVILGLPTWQLHGSTPDRYQLSNRTWPKVAPLVNHKSADDVVVLILHRCGFKPLATGPPIQTTNRNHTQWPDEIPF